MKIVAVRSFLKAMALTKPYSIAGYTFSDVSLAFLEIELANGIIGLGTGSPAEEVVGESAEMTAEHLKSDMVQTLVGRDITDFQAIISFFRAHFAHLPGTQAAIDIALHDAYGKYRGVSVLSLYGRKIQALPTSVTIGIMSVADALAEALAYEKLGFKILKVKTGFSVEEDIERFQKLHARVGSRMKIRVDPNQGYSLSCLQQFLAACPQAELIEQPLPVGQESLLIALDSLKLMADESITDTEAAKRFAEKPRAFQIFNIKLMKAGGIQGAMEIAQIALRSQIDLFWGCNDESILSITAALHAAYAMPNTRYLDLDGSFDLAEDLVTGGFRLKDGYMEVLDLPGFGVNRIA
jgi:L-alanine-DL-glutamate epimerase-like enolase superfamily enzyme